MYRESFGLDFMYVLKKKKLLFVFRNNDFFLKIILDAFFVLIKMQTMQKSKEKKMKNTSGPLCRWNYLKHLTELPSDIFVCVQIKN